MFVFTVSEKLLDIWRESCVFTWRTQFVLDRVPCFQSPDKPGMFCGSKYVDKKTPK